jgi:hypothetical protein
VKLLENNFENTIKIAQNVVVPKTYDVIPAFFQHRSTRTVCSDVFSMLTAVNLDDQFPFQSDKVDNEPGERNLPFEFDTIELTRSKSRPKEAFSFGRILAERAGALSQKLSPLTLPSPQRGEGHFI